MPRRLRAVLAVVTVLVAWATAGSAAHATSWVPGPTLTDIVAQTPRVATGSDGGATVLWTGGTPGAPSGTVTVRRVAADGTAGAVHGLGEGVGLDVEATGAGARVAWAEVAASGTALDVKTTTLSSSDVTSGTRTVTVATASAAREPLGAIAPDGSVVVSWLEDDRFVPGESTLKVRRIAADGSLGPDLDLGLAVTEERSYQLVVGGDGVGRVMWRKPDDVGGGLLIARIGADGAETGTDLLTVSPEGTATLHAEGVHAIVGWLEAVIPGDMASPSMLRTKRLPSNGSVDVSPTTIVSSLFAPFPSVGFALAPDGAATVAWSQSVPDRGNSVLNVRRIGTNGSLGAVRTLTTPPAGSVDLDPSLARHPDGTTIVVWSRMNLATFSATIVSGRLAVDGTPVAGELPVTFPSAMPVSKHALSVGPAGNALVAALGVRSDINALSLQTSLLPVPPVDPGPGPGPGPSPGPTPGPGPGPGPTPDPGSGPGPHLTPGPDPAPPVGRRSPARLKLTKATRKGARVTVSGTVDRRASGRVTLAWKQKVGRKTVTRTARATIKRGRFSATIKLPRNLVRSKAVGRLTVTYAGNATFTRGTVERTVRPAKANASPKRA